MFRFGGGDVLIVRDIGLGALADDLGRRAGQPRAAALRWRRQLGAMGSTLWESAPTIRPSPSSRSLGKFQAGA